MVVYDNILFGKLDLIFKETCNKFSEFPYLDIYIAGNLGPRDFRFAGTDGTWKLQHTQNVVIIFEQQSEFCIFFYVVVCSPE
jgi:hypothetical protein